MTNEILFLISIAARDKAMVINLEFIKAIVTAEEVLLLDPVLPFADQLRRQLLPHKSQSRIEEASPVQVPEGLQCDLPFEFQVLEIALEVVCTYLDSSVAELEMEAYPVLDELARNVSTKNLELVRSLKSNLTRLLARVQKVRDEIEHLLDDNEDMAHLYLTRKSEAEALLGSNSISPRRNNIDMDEDDVEDLEMLLEAYFMQLDGTCNKILCVRQYGSISMTQRTMSTFNLTTSETDSFSSG